MLQPCFRNDNDNLNFVGAKNHRVLLPVGNYESPRAMYSWGVVRTR